MDARGTVKEEETVSSGKPAFAPEVMPKLDPTWAGIRIGPCSGWRHRIKGETSWLYSLLRTTSWLHSLLGTEAHREEHLPSYLTEAQHVFHFSSNAIFEMERMLDHLM